MERTDEPSPNCSEFSARTYLSLACWLRLGVRTGWWSFEVRDRCDGCGYRSAVGDGPGRRRRCLRCREGRGRVSRCVYSKKRRSQRSAGHPRKERRCWQRAYRCDRHFHGSIHRVYEYSFPTPDLGLDLAAPRIVERGVGRSKNPRVRFASPGYGNGNVDSRASALQQSGRLVSLLTCPAVSAAEKRKIRRMKTKRCLSGAPKARSEFFSSRRI